MSAALQGVARRPGRRQAGRGTRRRWLGTAAKAVVSGALIYYLARGLDWRELADTLAAARLGPAAAAVLLFAFSNCLGAIQWHLLLRAQRLTIAWPQSWVLYFVGVFFNNVLLGNIGGDAVRIYDVRRLTGQGSAGAAATMMDRFFGLLTTCSLALAVYPLIAGADRAWVVSVLVPVWLALVVVLGTGLSQRLGGLLEAAARRLLPAAVADLLSSLRRAVFLYRGHLALLAAIFVISLGVQFCRILVYYEAGLAVGMDARLTYFVCFQPVAAVIAALPVSVGGLGVREGTLVGLFGGIGVARDTSLAMSLLGYLAGVLASLLGGIAFVLRRVETPNHAPVPGAADGASEEEV